MKYPFKITVNNHQRALLIKDNVQIGHYFVFVKQDARWSGKGRRLRLIIEKKIKNRVLALVDKPVQLDGVTITPEPRFIEPIGCVVADRDIYRAEQDTVHLFIAFPSPPKYLRLAIDYNGEFFADRPVELTEGVGIETLVMLLPGVYTAQLSIGDRRIGTPVSFSVAEYSLPPLSARLVSYKLKREIDQLWFEVAVESYQRPFNDELIVALVEKGNKIEHIGLLPFSPGHYAAGIKIQGEGPFSLRLMAAEDTERVVEVAIPASRAVEREVTVISELGNELLFSMMPEADALPVRGGYLSEGDLIGTPLTVESIITDHRLMQVKANIESLVLVILDLTTGDYSVQDVGNVSVGNNITVKTESSFCMVFVGGFVNGQAFEAYTTYVKSSPFLLSVEAPKVILPREDLVVRLRCGGLKDKKNPVLLCVSDERLIAGEKPAVSLGTAAKRAIDVATEGMDERAFSTLSQFEEIRFPRYEEESLSFEDELDLLEEDFLLGDEENAVDDLTLETEQSRSEAADDLSLVEELALLDNDFSNDKKPESLLAQKTSFKKDSPRTEFPEVLFYDIIHVTEMKDVVIPLSDSLGSFTVESFAMIEGDWIQNQTTVVVDKPVRVELEMPPIVHFKDKVIGRLRAITTSGKANITLTQNGKTVALCNGKSITALSIHTPTTLEFYVKSGIYIATVEESLTGETDSIELVVDEPSKFKSYAKELGLLFSADSIKRADSLSLRVLPNIDISFESLLTATANYAHLCCEQTAAKILAATFMYLTAKNEGQRNSAEEIILAGIAREQKMIRPKQGFAMYPNDIEINEYYSELTVRYLWKLEELDAIPDLSNNLRQAMREGVSMADNVAQAHDMQRVPSEVQNIEDIYTLAVLWEDNHAVGRELIENLIDFSGSEPCLKVPQHAVVDRQSLAYAAASLIVMGDFKNGIKLANQVTRQLNEQGRLYSTEDSVAAIALLSQLRKSGLVTSEARLKVNGEEMMAIEAALLNVPIESIEVLSGVAAVEVTRLYEEDWTRFADNFPISIRFVNANNSEIQQVRAGECIELIISLPRGYQTGDMVHVALPPCLSWIRGEVKLFSLDFEGEEVLRIPLLVTSQIEGQEHFAVCVRNMFREERASSRTLFIK
ncbi:hypothetical protein PN36_10295 [Candidatus Thiomargarita nelsonii]|uniref:Alpha-2-macroglobulin domain-containing protein n=1 Tax=Candidatus Thiomargarita nelsonii TaxID=1003181 RepID=A0A0A6RR33_9GAMM|nr:hypothetical protein PN36_10295 [Candidatus Thiomargarita nelsonii]